MFVFNFLNAIAEIFRGITNRIAKPVCLYVFGTYKSKNNGVKE